MLVFLAIAAFVAAILWRQIGRAFQTNPGLNGLILGVLVVGIGLAFLQVNILVMALAIGAATTIMATSGMLLGRFLGAAIGQLCARYTFRPEELAAVAATQFLFEEGAGRLAFLHRTFHVAELGFELCFVCLHMLFLAFDIFIDLLHPLGIRFDLL